MLVRWSLANLTEYRELDANALETRRKEIKEELFRLRVQHATLQLTATSRLGELRRQVAQIKTIQREREFTQVSSDGESE